VGQAANTPTPTRSVTPTRSATPTMTATPQQPGPTTPPCAYPPCPTVQPCAYPPCVTPTPTPQLRTLNLPILLRSPASVAPPTATPTSTPVPSSTPTVPAPTGPRPGYWCSDDGSVEFWVTDDGSAILPYQIYVNFGSCGDYVLYTVNAVSIINDMYSFHTSGYAWTSSGTFVDATSANVVDELSNYYVPYPCSRYFSGGPWYTAVAWRSYDGAPPARVDDTGIAPATGRESHLSAEAADR
jgi:hypothetical protein